MNRVFKRALAPAAAVMALATAAPAFAAQYIATYTGRVLNSRYSAGDFGRPAPGAQLGDPHTLLAGDYTAVLRFEFPSPGVTTQMFGPTRVATGPASFISGDLTIDIWSFHFVGSPTGTAGQVLQRNLAGDDVVGHQVAYFTDDGRFRTSNFLNMIHFGANIVDGVDLTHPFEYDAQPGDQSNSGFQISFVDYLNNQTFDFADGNLGIDHISLRAAAPEPATWAMLLLGFASLGATLRRRRLATS